MSSGRIRNRSLSPAFIQELTTGMLKPFLDRVKQDSSLYLAIRNEYINIYYRGGNLLRIRRGRAGYIFEFDEKYCLQPADGNTVRTIPQTDALGWYSSMDWLKTLMDDWLQNRKSNLERIFQQNLATSNADCSQDYMIFDIEYAGGNRGDQFRVDMLALRKVDDHYNLVLIENKFGTSAIGGKAGLFKHYVDTQSLIHTDKEDLIRVASEMIQVRTDLGLCTISPPKEEIVDCEMLFLLVDYNRSSKSLDNAIAMIKPVYDKTIRTSKIYMCSCQHIIHAADVSPLL